MTLPTIDVGLMNEHLSTHKGVIPKLKKYYTEVHDPYLKHLIYSQIQIMDNHVQVMLTLLDPSHTHWIQVLPLQQVLQYSHVEQIKSDTDQSIVLETHSTAKFMANSNFTSALMMKDSNVKQVHHDMALQQAAFEKMYRDYIKKMSWSVAPTASRESQLKIINHFLS